MGEVNFASQSLINPYIDRKLFNEVLSTSWVLDRNTPPPRVTDVRSSCVESRAQINDREAWFM
jgi:hypothetical protein